VFTITEMVPHSLREISQQEAANFVMQDRSGNTRHGSDSKGRRRLAAADNWELQRTGFTEDRPFGWHSPMSRQGMELLICLPKALRTLKRALEKAD
jgi:hypothetical protein